MMIKKTTIRLRAELVASSFLVEGVPIFKFQPFFFIVMDGIQSPGKTRRKRTSETTYKA
jgi:hypothetical protein